MLLITSIMMITITINIILNTPTPEPQAQNPRTTWLNERSMFGNVDPDDPPGPGVEEQADKGSKARVQPVAVMMTSLVVPMREQCRFPSWEWPEVMRNHMCSNM